MDTQEISPLLVQVINMREAASQVVSTGLGGLKGSPCVVTLVMTALRLKRDAGFYEDPNCLGPSFFDGGILSTVR